jgi:cystathionine beta-lyase family protein involved in aluminum resistance
MACAMSSFPVPVSPGHENGCFRRAYQLNLFQYLFLKPGISKDSIKAVSFIEALMKIVVFLLSFLSFNPRMISQI